MLVCSIDVGIRNTFVCVVDTPRADAKEMEIVRWEHFDFGGGSVRMDTTPRVVSRFVEAFFRDFDWSAVDVVLVESQTRSTAKIRCLSFAMQAFFETLRLADPAQCHYEFLWSVGSCKLSVLGRNRRAFGPSRGYAANKRLAVEHVTILLAEVASFHPWQTFYRDLPKKDDAADALLQALAYLMKKGHFAGVAEREPLGREGCEIDD